MPAVMLITPSVLDLPDAAVLLSKNAKGLVKNPMIDTSMGIHVLGYVLAAPIACTTLYSFYFACQTVPHPRLAQD